MTTARKEMRTTRTVRRLDESQEAKGAAPLQLQTLLAIIGCAAVATAMGMSLVKIEFSARDYEIEARRVQELTNARRDAVKQLEADLGMVTRDEMLRQAALTSLGMTEPGPGDVGSITVEPADVFEWKSASAAARQSLDEERNAWETRRQEVF